MPRASRQNPDIQAFILANVAENPDSIAALTASHFGLSRVAVGKTLKRLVDEGKLLATGRTRDRRYRLAEISFTTPVGAWLDEDMVWRMRLLPHLLGIPKNVLDICQYGFTEMLNNVIDHSGSKDAIISCSRTERDVKMWVIDHGMGIFERIQRDFVLADARTALLELSKGKLTSDPERHAGEGVFFTSRMFDKFSIHSSTVSYIRSRQHDDEWLIETEEKDYSQGTAVMMLISLDADWTMRDVFNAYIGDATKFRRTHVPILVSRYPNEQLVSRSQAKRILARFDQFSEAMLDFDGVDQIGQPFADEIFRVFAKAHPQVRVVWMNANPDIEKMIAYVRGPQHDEQFQLL